jgi:uncharacterized protein YoxC
VREDHDMALRIGGLPLLTPSDLAAAGRSLLGWTDEAVQLVADLPRRVAALVDEAEHLIDRLGGTLDGVDVLMRRVDAVLADVGTVVAGASSVATRADEVAASAGGVVTRADAVTSGAQTVVDEAQAATRTARELLDLYAPTAERAAPLVRRFVAQVSDHEVEAMIRLIDHVPQFTEHMESDIMPVLAKLDQVGPDVHELLDVLKDVRLAIQGLPGFALFRRRGADLDDDLADDRPETPPPVERN